MGRKLEPVCNFEVTWARLQANWVVCAVTDGEREREAETDADGKEDEGCRRWVRKRKFGE